MLPSWGFSSGLWHSIPTPPQTCHFLEQLFLIECTWLETPPILARSFIALSFCFLCFVFFFLLLFLQKPRGAPIPLSPYSLSFEGELIGEVPVGRSANIQEPLCGPRAALSSPASFEDSRLVVDWLFGPGGSDDSALGTAVPAWGEAEVSLITLCSPGVPFPGAQVPTLPSRMGRSLVCLFLNKSRTNKSTPIHGTSRRGRRMN